MVPSALTTGCFVFRRSVAELATERARWIPTFSWRAKPRGSAACKICGGEEELLLRPGAILREIFLVVILGAATRWYGSILEEALQYIKQVSLLARRHSVVRLFNECGSVLRIGRWRYRTLS